MIMQNSSNFLVKNKQTYSTESHNLKLATPSAMKTNPTTSYVWTTISKNTQANLSSTRHMICKNKYSSDLHSWHLQSQHHPA
ncbi:unnamed protein product [Nyctereutes procyonoides]|uniref:(raccoon dog) hypothetical protein n=1 Tax=Nyctereutes procyonoides TaxID=34880 RepID=A0A811Y675_NYCPR|nr:unnamed protein product [Nyctereutes procyonoides]